MTTTNTPNYLEDAKKLLSAQGFIASNTWYHGTSSALVGSIEEQGLIRSGDIVLSATVKKTMVTIGLTVDNHTKSREPVFLTPSKELAFYWAEQTVRHRSAKIMDNGKPVVFSVTLPDELNRQVKPDVGAASQLLLTEGEDFMAFLAGVYQINNLEGPTIDLMVANRKDYLSVLGMAYINADVAASYVKLVTNH